MDKFKHGMTLEPPEVINMVPNKGFEAEAIPIPGMGKQSPQNQGENVLSETDEITHAPVDPKS